MNDTDALIAMAIAFVAILAIVVLICTDFRCSDADDRRLEPCIPQGVTGTLEP